jgi:hypothetical protein
LYGRRAVFGVCERERRGSKLYRIEKPERNISNGNKSFWCFSSTHTSYIRLPRSGTASRAMFDVESFAFIFNLDALALVPRELKTLRTDALVGSGRVDALRRMRTSEVVGFALVNVDAHVVLVVPEAVEALAFVASDCVHALLLAARRGGIKVDLIWVNFVASSAVVIVTCLHCRGTRRRHCTESRCLNQSRIHFDMSKRLDCGQPRRYDCIRHCSPCTGQLARMCARRRTGTFRRDICK